MRTNAEHVLARRESVWSRFLFVGNAWIHLEQILVLPLMLRGPTTVGGEQFPLLRAWIGNFSPAAVTSVIVKFMWML